MSLQKLLKILPPPAKPYYAVTDVTRWLDVEQKLGSRFPSDFKDFIGVYGNGVVDDFVLIFNPFPEYKWANFFYNIEFVLGDMREFPGRCILSQMAYSHLPGLMTATICFGKQRANQIIGLLW